MRYLTPTRSRRTAPSPCADPINQTIANIDFDALIDNNTNGATDADTGNDETDEN